MLTLSTESDHQPPVPDDVAYERLTSTVVSELT